MRKSAIAPVVCVLAIFLCFLFPLFVRTPAASAEPVKTDWSERVPGVDYREGEVIVGLVDDATEDTASEVAEFYGFTLKKILSFCDWEGGKIALFSLPDGVSVPEAIDILSENSSVAYAEPNGIGHIATPPSDVDAADETDWSQLVPGVDYVEGQVNVRFFYGTTRETIRTVIESYGFSIGANWFVGGDEPVLVLALLPEGISVPDAIQVLIQNPLVARAEPNMYSHSVSQGAFQRLAGADRYNTGTTIVGNYLAAVDTVILATGESYPDALCASALAGKEDAPIIIVPSGYRLPRDAVYVIYQLRPNTIRVVGGASVVSEDAVFEACAYRGIDYRDATRYHGADRYATCLDIYQKGGFDSDTCIVATGGNFADALSISPYAYASETPIFLVDPNTLKLNATIEAAIKGDFDKVIIVGGTGVVSDAVVGQIGATSMVRLSGPSRYDTSLAIAKWEMGLDNKAAFGPVCTLSMANVSLATGENYPDALSGGPYCGKNNSVLLLVGERKSDYQGALELVRANASSIKQGYIFGGPGAVSDALKARFDAALG